jgi:aminoglycoside phosphotransferase family enzyme
MVMASRYRWVPVRRVSRTAGAALPGSAGQPGPARLETRADAARVLSFLLAEAGRGEVTLREAEKLARLVSEHHKAVQLTEMEERLGGVEEALGLVPGPG